MPFLIVIDALDESRQEDRYELVDLISKHFPKLPSYIRFLITTRSEKDIVRKFQTLKPIFLEPDEKRSLSDLRVFFENKLKIRAVFFVEDLVKKSEGLMLYASFIAKLFEDNSCISYTESLPEGIEEIYEPYFKRLEKDMKKLGIGEDKFSSLLSIVAVAKQPLPLPFIEKLLCPEKDLLSARRMLLQLISCVSSLLVVKDECISIFHKSVRDWLVKPDHYFTIIEAHGHKTLADICVGQMQTLKQYEIRFTFDFALDYALRYGIPHILEAEIKDELTITKLIDTVIDLEIVHSSVCISVYTTLNNFDNLTGWDMFYSLCDETRAAIKMLIRILRKFTHILHDTPHTFLQRIANEKIKGLSTEASGLLMTRYKKLAYFELKDLEQTSLLYDRIKTKKVILEVDVSPSENFIIFRYEDKVIELFSLSSLKRLWKIDDVFVGRSGCDSNSVLYAEIVPHCIVFHPFLDIIFPAQLDPVINLEGKLESGPIACGNTPVKFTNCCFSHDHTKMVTYHHNHLKVWNLCENEKVAALPCDSSLYSILFSGNDRYIATTELSFFKVYDAENGYCLRSVRSNIPFAVVVSTFELDSWYCWSDRTGKGYIVRYDLITNQPNVYMDFMLSPCNAKATAEFQAIMKNETPMWFPKLGSRGNFFILDSGNVLFFTFHDREIRIVKTKELIKGCKLKQQYNEWLTGSLFLREESVIISVDGRFIYTSSPCIGLRNAMLCSTRPGKSWKLIPIDYTPFLSVTNGVFAMKVKRDLFHFNGGTPELWNADLTECLFNFPELTGTFHCLSVTENLVACIMKLEVRFFDVVKKEIVACTQLPESNRNSNFVIACSSQYQVVYRYSKHKYTLLLEKTNVVNLSERVLNNLKPTMKYIHTACFSPSGRLLAFPSDNKKLIHILDLLTYEICCNIPLNIKVPGPKYFDEEHLLCCESRNDRDYLCLINVKTCNILSSIIGGVNYGDGWKFSVCRKTSDVVVFNRKCKTLEFFKLWLPHQRKNENELQESRLLIHA